MKLVVATDIPKLTEFLEENYEVKVSVDNLSGLERLFSSTVAPGDTLLVTEKIKSEGSIISSLLKIHKNFPSLRIIYFSSGNLEDPYTVNQLYSLASNGIYDLYYGNGVSESIVNDYLKRPRLKIDCQEIFEAKSGNEIFIQTDTRVLDASKSNVFAVTSVKPGTGKSFVSSNLAVTLAKYGKNKEGKPAKVLLLEGDLQTLSITTLFGLRDEDYNLKTALDKIDAYLQSHSSKEWFSGAEDIKEFIMRCCLRTSVDNLFAIEGHTYDFNDIIECESQTYYYLLDYLSREFDYVIVDCNSSLQHPTTDPIFQLAKKLYFVFTTDYNNIQLNVKFLNEIEDLGLENKVRFVLNRTLVGQQKETFQFEYTDREIIGEKFKIDFEIPLVDTATTLNSTYLHKQIASNEDIWTLPARLKFIRLAQDISPLTNLESIYGEIALLKKKHKGNKELKKMKKKKK